MCKSGFGVFVLVSVFSLSCMTAEAETNHTATADMPAVVVTATRDMRLLKDAPYSTGVLNADTLRIENAVRSVPEALKYEPGIMVQKTAHGQGSPYIRGFTSQRNLFLIDGIRLNNSVFRDGPNQYWNTVDPLSLSRIEVARGPFSVLYGSDAIGGTVNAVTRGVKDLRPQSNSDTTLYYRYASGENSHIARAENISRLTEKLTLSLGYSYKDFGDIEGGSDVGTQPHTGYDERDWDAKLEYFVTEDAFFVLAHQSVDIDDAWRTHKTIYGIDWEGLSVGKELQRVLDQSRDLTYLQFHQYNSDSFAEEVHAGISYQSQSEDRNRLRTRDRRDVQGFDADTLGVFMTLESPSSIGNLIYGTEFYHDSVDSYKHKLNPDLSVKSVSIQGPVGDDADYDTLGFFLQDEISLSEKLSLIIGGRYDYAAADADSVEDPASGDEISVSESWDNVSGSARMLYYLDQKRNMNIFAGISQGFRAPNLSDLTRLDSARTDEIETPSPNLDPEYFVSYEIGVKTATPVIAAQMSLFYTDIDGMIVRTPTGRMIDDEYEVTKKNAGNGYAGGVELDAKYRFGRGFTALGVFTWMEGKVDTYPTSDAVTSSEYIDRLMPPTGMFGLRWNSESKHSLKFEGLCRVAAKADRLSTRDKSDTSRIPPGGTPGYAVYDLRASRNVGKSITMSLAVENITNEDYRIHGSGLNEVGRNIVVAVQSRF